MNALTINNLTKRYGNGFQALKNISLSVEEGDFFALLGANGAGKSTTIGIISSLINKTSGEVRVFDKDLDKDVNAVKSYIGLVPQEFNCNIFECCEQILTNQAGYYGLPLAIAQERAEHYLNKLGLWDKRKETAKSLSGGMKRRLMIARALVHQPKMLILDEPTAGVDIEIRHDMWQFLQALNQSGTTIILTTHYLEEAEKLCRNIAIIKQGEIALQSAMSDLLAKAHNRTLIVELQQAITSELPDFKHFKAQLLSPKKLEITLNDQENLNNLFAELTQHHLLADHIQHDKNRLENLFLGLIKDEHAV